MPTLCYPGKKDHHKRVTTENIARPSRRKILNHGNHGTTRKGDPNVFSFLCPSRGQLPPVGWGRSVVITPARKFRILAHTNPTRQRGL